MLYRTYGKTGKKISIISAGGMRYPEPEKINKMAQIPFEAAKLGVNYFDTAPYYCNDKSQAILGKAIKEMKKAGYEYYVATKSGAHDEKSLFKDLENSLKVMDIDHIDFYHSWGVNSVEILKDRKKKGAFKALKKAKEQGLITHIVCSSHMAGSDMAEYLTKEDILEGITLGFCAINFPFRMEGVKAAYARDWGVVTMNPLGGGMITDTPDRFDFIKTYPGQSILEAALHFNLAHNEITSALVGFRSIEDVRTAIKTLDTFKPLSQKEMEKIKSHIEDSFDQFCTTCNYCKDCPQDIPVAKFVEAFNHYMLYNKPDAAFNRLKWHWNIETLEKLEDCTECRQCEEACTQKLPILDRFKKLKELKKKLKQR